MSLHSSIIYNVKSTITDVTIDYMTSYQYYQPTGLRQTTVTLSDNVMYVDLTSTTGKSSHTVLEKINLANINAYKRTGKGVHGGGTRSLISAKIILTHMTPMVLFQLEVVTLTKTEKASLRDVTEYY